MLLNGITPAQMLTAGITIAQMLAVGITPAQMFNGGITPAQMFNAGITLSQMFNGGITPAQMFNGGITLSQMYSGGIGATYFRPINVLFYKRDTFGDTWNGNVINIRNKSTGQVLTTLTLTTNGQNWVYESGILYYGVEYEITKVIGGWPEEVLYAITTSSVTSYNGSQTPISTGTGVILAQQTNAFPSLKIMDFSLTSNPINISATQLKAAGYTATDLKAAGYTATDLKAAGYTQQDITSAGYTQTTTPSITNFSNLSKTLSEGSFTIVAPSSTSPSAFSYTSSDTSVATISGNIVTILKAGTTIITALQEETAIYYGGSISSVLTVIAKVASNLAIGSVSAKKFGDAAFTLPVTTSSTGSISYTSSVPSVATISSVGLVTIVGAGSTVLTVSQLTDANYFEGSATYTLTIEKTTSSLSMGSISEKTNGDVPFAVVVTTNSTGTISYTSSNTSVATVSNVGLVTILKAGSTVLTVSQLTDANYLAKNVEGLLIVKESSASNPTVISGGSGLNYFLNTSAKYAVLSGNISVTSGSLQSTNKKVIKASKRLMIKRG